MASKSPIPDAGLEELLTVDEASRLLKIPALSLYRAVETGKVPHLKLGRRVRFRASDLRAWLDSHRRGIAADEPR